MATTAQIREHYDSLALIYSTFWGDHIHHGLFETGQVSAGEAQVKMLSHCIQLAGIAGGEKILDCGCGHGGTLLHLATVMGCSGLGLTLSPKQAKIAAHHAARAGVGGKIEFKIQDVASFDFPKNEFDVGWAMESTEHFLDKPGFFRDVAATLRPGGKLLLAAWTGSMNSPRVAEVARAFLCPEIWTAEQYGATIAASGMQVEVREDLTPKIIRTWEICQQHASRAGAVVKLLPTAAREFIEGIEIILDAYRSSDLTYTVLSARK